MAKNSGTEEEMSVLFTGDISFSGYFKGREKREILSKEIIDYMNNNNHVIANIESPITNREISKKGKLTHVTNPIALDVLSYMNIDIWSLGNNHIMDCGKEGIEDTLINAKREGIRVLGAGINKKQASETLIIGDEVKIGVLSVTKEWNFVKSDDNTPGCIHLTDYETIKNQCQHLKSKVDYIVAIVHAGNEFSSMPMPYDRDKYIKLLDYGVDIIVGHHPHVVQNYEIINNKIIFYSLGNFIFDTDYQRVQKYSNCGILLKINFKNGGFEWEYLPVSINREKNIIEKCATPAIFTNINEKDYKNLWPIAAKQLLCNDIKAKRFKKPDFDKKSKLKKIKLYLDRYKRVDTRTIEIGSKFLYPIKKYSKIDSKLYDYIIEKK